MSAKPRFKVGDTVVVNQGHSIVYYHECVVSAVRRRRPRQRSRYYGVERIPRGVADHFAMMDATEDLMAPLLPFLRAELARHESEAAALRQRIQELEKETT